MIGSEVPIPPRPSIDDYEGIAHLAPDVERLRSRAAEVVPALRGRTVWMVNSTAHGGGVAEMLPTMICLLRELGVDARWFVLGSDSQAFFRLTKRVHNLIHGAGDPELTPGDRELFEAVNAENARILEPKLKDGDVLVVHDPQPMPLAGLLRERKRIRTIWRCHIGLDERNPATRAAWSFLEPYGADYDHAVFSAPEYVPGFLADRSHLIHPALDPLSPKNRELHLHALVGVLANSALAVGPGPVVRPAFPHMADRLQPDGTWRPAILPDDIGLLIRPIVTQISRWDRLKGWIPLLEGFTELKRRLNGASDGLRPERSPIGWRRLKLTRLVLAGPEAASISDDPEGLEVLEEVRRRYMDLDPAIQEDVAVVALPMQRPDQNALMVNALQRASTIIVQNSLREGFGLTISEGMWKRLPVLSNRRAVGPRQQIRDGVDGRLIDDPESPTEIAAALDELLSDGPNRACLARAAQRRAHSDFMIFGQLGRWLDLLET